MAGGVVSERRSEPIIRTTAIPPTAPSKIAANTPIVTTNLVRLVLGFSVLACEKVLIAPLPSPH